jgi:hypothetical protein
MRRKLIVPDFVRLSQLATRPARSLLFIGCKPSVTFLLRIIENC